MKRKKQSKYIREKESKKWAKHIIRKFGKHKALFYATGYDICPCSALCMACIGCIYRTRRSITLGCDAANDFISRNCSSDMIKYFIRRKMRCKKRWGLLNQRT
jgi:hypothetical protein